MTRIADSAQDARDFLQETARIASYDVFPIALSEQSDWSIVDGALSHRSGGFFSVVGVYNRGDQSDQRLMLYQPQSALTGLILSQTTGDLLVLLQARVEPGNTGVIQYGPTIQSTPANYLRLHGGKATAYVSQFTRYPPDATLLTHSMQLDLGCRYFQKSKTHHYLEVEQAIDTEENMIWVPINVLGALLEEDNFLNADLRSLLAVFDWSNWQGEKTRPPANGALDKVVADVAGDAPGIGHYKLGSVGGLAAWSISDAGIRSESEDAAVRLFHFACSNREVSSWDQPLFEVGKVGLMQLLMRRDRGEVEFLITVGSEPGLSTDHALYPSRCSSPLIEQHPGAAPFAGELIRNITQCDEGGRFLRNEALYELRLSDGSETLESNQVWVTASQLRTLLRSSNRASFQLRCAASLALPWLHAAVFGDG